MQREDLLGGKTGNANRQGVPLVVAYSGHLPNISKILREKKYISSRSDKLKRIFNHNMFVSYKRGTNLRDLLVHKKTKRLGQGPGRWED